MIYFCEGGKGGVGKSLMTTILMNYLYGGNKQHMLIETDTSNPDTYKAHEKFYICELQKIDSMNDWAKFLTLLDNYKDSNIVVNMPARNQDSIKNWGETIKEISNEILVFFMLNTQKDSALLLKNYAQIIAPEHIIPTKNLYFGASDEFSLYDNSQVKNLFNKEFYIDPLIDSAASLIYNERKSLQSVGQLLNVGDRIFFQKWLNETRARLEELL